MRSRIVFLYISIRNKTTCCALPGSTNHQGQAVQYRISSSDRWRCGSWQVYHLLALFQTGLRNMRFLRCLRNIFSNVSLSFSFLFLSGIYIQYTRFLSAKKINTEHFFGLCPDIWLIFDNNGKPSICSHFRLCRKNIFSASFVDFFCNLSILRKKGVILMKVKYIFLIMLLLILAVCLTTCASYNTSDKDWPTYDSMSTAVNISFF